MIEAASNAEYSARTRHDSSGRLLPVTSGDVARNPSMRQLDRRLTPLPIVPSRICLVPDRLASSYLCFTFIFTLSSSFSQPSY